MRDLAFEIKSSAHELWDYLQTLTPAEEKACLDELHDRFLLRCEQEQRLQVSTIV